MLDIFSVGGALLLKYGPQVQEPLQEYLSQRGVSYTNPGDVVVTTPSITPYKAILHAVTVDGMYESDSALVKIVVERALRYADQYQAESIALPALATGYGRLALKGFVEGILAVPVCEYATLQRAIICARNESQANEIRDAMQL